MLRPAAPIAAVALLCHPAPGELPEDAPAPMPSRDAWRLERAHLELAAWYAAASGNLRLPGSTPDPAPSLAALNLDSPALQPMLRLDLLFDNPGSAQRPPPKARLTFSGFAYSQTGSAFLTEPVSLGSVQALTDERVETRLRVEHVSAGAGLRLVGFDEQPDRFTARLDALVGMHAFRTDTRHRVIQAAPGSGTPLADRTAQRDDTWFFPYLGARLDMDFERRFLIHLESTVGGIDGIGDNAGLAWDIHTGFNYRPHPAVILGVGYRNLSLNLDAGPEQDPAKWRGALAGLTWQIGIDF